MPSGSGWNLRYITLSNEEERGRKRKRGERERKSERVDNSLLWDI